MPKNFGNRSPNISIVKIEKREKTPQDEWNSTSKPKKISNGGIVYQNLNEVLPKCDTFEPMHRFNLQNGLNYFVIENEPQGC
jgi:hypothetical protein